MYVSDEARRRDDCVVEEDGIGIGGAGRVEEYMGKRIMRKRRREVVGRSEKGLLRIKVKD